VLEQYNVESVGAPLEAIRKAEDRSLFKQTMLGIGLEVPESKQVDSLRGALEVAKELGYPLIAA